MKDSMGPAQSLINMAIIQTNQADYFGGIETSVLAENKSGIIDSLFHELNIDGFVKNEDTTQKSLKKPSKLFRTVKNIFL